MKTCSKSRATVYRLALGGISGPQYVEALVEESGLIKMRSQNAQQELASQVLVVTFEALRELVRDIQKDLAAENDVQ